MRTIEASSEALAGAVASGQSLVLFHAKACPFCRAFAPTFRAAVAGREELQPAEVLLDDWDGPLWNEFSIDLVPTVILFADGRPVARRDGKPRVGLRQADLEGLLGEISAS